MYFILCIVLILTTVNSQLYEGESCTQNNKVGSCLRLSRCQSAIDGLRNRVRPQTCSYLSNEPVVCCFDGGPTTDRNPAVPITTKRAIRTTTIYIPTVADYVDVNDNKPPSSCSPIEAGSTAKKDGRKAWDKCIEYQEKYVYPCARGVSLAGTLSRQNYCHHKVDQLIIGGEEAAKHEFPHMVLLGYGDQPGNFICAGSIISENFILTAGHCVYSREFGNVTWARINVLQRSEGIDRERLYKIATIIKHPDYKPPSKYNDLALLRTERIMVLDHYTVPACLDVGTGSEHDTAIATGWGLTSKSQELADVLQKVRLTGFSHAECAQKFPKDRHSKIGIDASTQICYGDKTKSRDACQGDSGGPLQVFNRVLKCMYNIIGVTSYGKGCGTVGLPGIYTRIAHYVPWIESVVWP